MGYLRTLVNRIEKGTEKLKFHTIYGRNEDEWELAQGDRKNIEWMEKYQKIYDRGGVVTMAVDTIPEYMFAGIDDIGVGFIGRDSPEEQKEYLQQWAEGFDFIGTCEQAVIMSLVSGRSIGDLVQTASGRIKYPLIRNPAKFDVQLNNKGLIEKYYQITKNGYSTQKKPVDAGNIWDLRMLPSTDQRWGRSMIGTAFDEIDRDTKTAEGTTNGILRHGTPKMDVIVDTENYELDDDDMERIADKFKEIHSKNDFIHGKELELRTIDTGTVQIGDYNLVSISRLCAALGVPEEVLGLGRGSTEATANIRLKSFEKRIKAFQTRFNHQLYDQVLRPVLADVFPPEEIKPVYMKFGDINTEELLQKVQAAKSMIGVQDPFEVWHRDEIRAVTNHPEYDSVEDSIDEEDVLTDEELKRDIDSMGVDMDETATK